MNPVVTIIIVLIIAIVIGTGGVLYTMYRNSQEPEVTRKWTDPSFRDHMSRKE
jgi:hypothetical protein